MTSGIDNMAGGPKTSDKDCQKGCLVLHKSNTRLLIDFLPCFGVVGNVHVH